MTKPTEQPIDPVVALREKRRLEREQREDDELADTVASFLRTRGMNPDGGPLAVNIAKIRRRGAR